jgi:8-oxo-dGTP diphosphatase
MPELPLLAFIEKFGATTRIRVCGFIVRKESLLLTNHPGLGENGYFLSPPGGGVEFEEPLVKTLIREIYEETGLFVLESHFHCVGEYIDRGLHTIEIFFYVTKYEGDLKLGLEPELPGAMTEVRFYSFEELKQFSPAQLHGTVKELLEKGSVDAFKGGFLDLR